MQVLNITAYTSSYLFSVSTVLYKLFFFLPSFRFSSSLLIIRNVFFLQNFPKCLRYTHFTYRSPLAGVLTPGHMEESYVLFSTFVHILSHIPSHASFPAGFIPVCRSRFPSRRIILLAGKNPSTCWSADDDFFSQGVATSLHFNFIFKGIFTLLRILG